MTEAALRETLARIEGLATSGLDSPLPVGFDPDPARKALRKVQAEAAKALREAKEEA